MKSEKDGTPKRKISPPEILCVW